MVVDGTNYNVHISSLSREASVLDGENAGRMRSGAMERDIIGTYVNYTVKIDADALTKTEYDALFEVLSAPVKFHTITMPYGQSNLTYKAYVSGVKDNLNLSTDQGNSWGNMEFKFVALAPNRRG